MPLIGRCALSFVSVSSLPGFLCRVVCAHFNEGAMVALVW